MGLSRHCEEQKLANGTMPLEIAVNDGG